MAIFQHILSRKNAEGDLELYDTLYYRVYRISGVSSIYVDGLIKGKSVASIRSWVETHYKVNASELRADEKKFIKKLIKFEIIPDDWSSDEDKSEPKGKTKPTSKLLPYEFGELKVENIASLNNAVLAAVSCSSCCSAGTYT